MAKKAKSVKSTSAARGQTEPKWGGISSSAVEKATGKGWAQWCKTLDADKAAARTHKEIAALLHTKHGVAEWWSQMVTVGYEQARGLREKNQKADGFSTSASRVFGVPMAKAFKAVSDDSTRAKWLNAKVTVTKATPGKSIRMAQDDGTRIGVYFWDKSGKTGTKTQVVFQHEKLKNAAAVPKMKKVWTGRLDALEKVLGG